MERIKVGIFGFGKTGRMIVNEFLQDEHLTVQWVIRKTHNDNHKYASRLLGYERDTAEIFSIEDLHPNFFAEHPVDVIVDFSDSSGVQNYGIAADLGVSILSAISKYTPEDLDYLLSLSKKTAVMYSPNITLGINILLIASQIIQKIAPHADIEIVEEHFKSKTEISGTAKKIASSLSLEENHINSIRVGGIVGKHEIIFGLPNQTLRLTHESISRGAFGQGAIFATKHLAKFPAGLYTMETIISDLFKNNIPIY